MRGRARTVAEQMLPLPAEVQVLAAEGRIGEFDGIARFLSNFWLCPVEFEGVRYPSSEHAYQAAKTLGLEARRAFEAPTMSAGRAKRLGQALKLRPGWEAMKLDVMRTCLMSKFGGGALLELLLATGEAALVEGNRWHDNTWGDCLCGVGKCAAKGENLLGKLLMLVRAELAGQVAQARMMAAREDELGGFPPGGFGGMGARGRKGAIDGKAG